MQLFEKFESLKLKKEKSTICPTITIHSFPENGLSRLSG